MIYLLRSGGVFIKTKAVLIDRPEILKDVVRADSEQLLPCIMVNQHFPEKNLFILIWKITYLWMWFRVAEIARV